MENAGSFLLGAQQLGAVEMLLPMYHTERGDTVQGEGRVRSEVGWSHLQDAVTTSSSQAYGAEASLLAVLPSLSQPKEVPALFCFSVSCLLTWKICFRPLS